MAKNDEVQVDNRVIYVEPNDNYLGITKTDSDIPHVTPLTPPLEDMCVSFNLTVDVHKRYKSNITSGLSSNDKGQMFGISWNSGDKLIDHFPFLSGVPMGINNTTGESNEYLTTYYTQISQDEYGNVSSNGKPSIIEGLGVASVDISYESWYTPTVVIKFVDVRGSVLFGVEEAIHDFKGQLTADNVYGCFFTVPQPLFRLQVKGYLGKPVTYQLTCSDCRGEFNSKTGDFEITVTFIGYSYNLLTDISMDFLIAAPYDKNFGENYWNSKMNDPEWAMSNGQPPMRLAEMFDKIKAAELATNGGTVSEEESSELNATSSKIQVLTDVIEKYKSFLDAYKTKGYAYREGTVDGKHQYVFFKGGSPLVENSDAMSRYGELLSAIEKCNEVDSSLVKASDLPNGSQGWPLSINFSPIFNINGGNITITGAGNEIVKMVDSSALKASLEKVKLNNGKTLNSAVISQIDKPFIESIKDNTVYAYVLNVGSFITDCETKRTEFETNKKNLESELEHRRETQLIDSLNFYPTIGNVFKTVMCHLETFVHIMMNAGEEIYGQIPQGLRQPNVLNISLTNTDIPEDKFSDVCPWPAVYGKGRVGATGDMLETDDYKAWVGDFSDKFIEMSVVQGLAAASMAIKEDKPANESKDIYIDSIPVAPTDIINGNPFAQTASTTSLPDLAYQLTVRCMQLFGVMYDENIGTDFIEAMGKADAINYVEKFKTIYGLKNDILSSANGNDIRNIIKGIALCNPDYDGDYARITSLRDSHRAYVFETQRSNHYTRIPRQPLMVEEGNNYKFSFTYMQTGNGAYFTGFSPIAPAEYNNNRCMNYATNGKDRFYMEHTEGKVKSCLSVTDSSVMAKYGAIDAIDLDRYINSCAFTVIQNPDDANALDKRYYDLSELNDITIQHSTVKGDFFKNIEERILRWKDGMCKYLSQNNSIYPSYSDMGIQCTSLSKNSNGKISIEPNDALSALLTKSSNGTYSNEEREAVWECDGNKTNQNDGCVWQNRFHTNNSSNFANIFGHPFFYMQNDNRGDIPAEDKEIVRRYSHALLLLCTQNLNNQNLCLDVFSSGKGKGGTYIIPYGYAALLGGLLWRSRYIDKHRKIGSNFDIFLTSCASYTPLKYKPLVVDRVGSYIEYTPYISGSGNDLCGGVIVDSVANNANNYSVPVYKIFGAQNEMSGNTWWPDCNIMNQLIEVFKDFARTYRKVIDKYELHSNKGTIMNIGAFMENMNDIVIGNAGNVVVDMKNIEGNYVYITKASEKNEDGLRMLYDVNDVAEQNCLKAMYGNKVVIGDGVRYKLKYNSSGTLDTSCDNEIRVPKSVYDSYVNSFVNQLTEILEGGEMTETRRTEITDNMRDIYIEMYSYLKNVWDKWLVTAESDYYDVRNFFDTNFVFIDSFYQKIYDKLPINCSILYDIMSKGSKDITLFTFINSLVTRHHCVFFALPDYIGFGKTRREDAETLASLFKPIPYNAMDGNLALSNKFVVIWVNPQSVHNGWGGEFKDDSFSICSFRSDTMNRLPAVFTKSCFPEGEEDNEASRQGYNVPAFGVAFGRQNNTIFKGIKVSMKNPVITSASAEMLAHIVEKGNENPTAIYQGQDMYGSVFSNYSYECEVEMMGNAQICPLMYFQLMNVPMWRGAYMVFKVKHSMSKNNMTTTFVGMKMGSKAVPFPTNYLNTSKGSGSGGFGGMNYGSSYTFNAGSAGDITLEPNYNKYLVVNTPNDHYRNKQNHQGSISFKTGSEEDKILANIFNNLFETIKALPENQGEKRWNVMLSSVYGTSGHSAGSDHYTGRAMDMVIQYFDKDWKPTTYTTAGSDRPQLFKVADIIYKHFWGHGNMKLIIEYVGSLDTALKGGDTSWMKLNCLHLSVRAEIGLVALWGNRGQSGKGRDLTPVSEFMKYVPEAFKYIAGCAYHDNKVSFNYLFRNYQGADEDSLKQHFSDIAGSGGFEAWWKWTKSWEGSTIKNYWVKGDTWNDYYGIIRATRVNMCQEMKTDPRTTKADDIARYIWNRYKMNLIKDGKLSMLVMFSFWQTGRFGIVKNALFGHSISYGAYPSSGGGPTELTDNMINTMNNSNGAEIFNNIKSEFKDLYNTWGNSGGSKYKAGWLNRLNSTSYQGEWMINK